MVQPPPMQATLAFAGGLQALPQAPQLASLFEVSMQTLSQHCCCTPPTTGQSPEVMQPMPHMYTSPSRMQWVPAGQLSLVGRHFTHLPVWTSQRGLSPP